MATLFNIPKGTYAQWRAQEIKDRRETEWEAPEAVFPARSAAHRDRLEELQREEELPGELKDLKFLVDQKKMV
jgi:hypothetical protein